MLGATLREHVRQHSLESTLAFVRQARSEGRITDRQVSLRNLAEGFLGQNWRPKMERLNRRPWAFRESQDAVDASSFSAITGQLLIDKVNEGYQLAEFIGDQLTQEIPVTNGNLSTQRVPWLSGVIDTPTKLQQGQPYPQTTFVPNYIDLPAPEKFGEICSVTAEMIFSDLTRQVMERAHDVGRRVRLNKEERQLDVVLGVAATAYRYSWNGTQYATYATSGNWINQKSGQQLFDWTAINELEQLAAQMLDPNLSKVIDIPTGEMKLLVMPYRKYNAKRALAATNTRSGQPGAGTSGNQVEAPNPLDTNYPILSSKHAYQRLLNTANSNANISSTNAIEYFYLGAFQRAFCTRVVWPFESFDAPPQSEAEFSQDILVRVKAREFSVPGVLDPRYVYRSINN